jgi:transitional endoplasmic reticulum ATPase
VSILSKTIDVLKDLAAKRPDDFDVRMELAELLSAEKQSEDALRVLDEAFALRPDNSEALRLYGRVLYDLNRFAEARDKLETASRKGLPDAKSDMLLSHLYSRLGDQERAYELYNFAVRRDRDLEDPSYLETIRPPKTPIAIKPGRPERGMEFEGEISRTTFKDVGGMDDVKEQFRMNIILPLKNPNLFRTYGKRIGGGILLFGPPGCGKTYLSRALAGECNSTFYRVGIHEILDKFLGESEKNMHNLFETARRHAPAVIFLDEIDLLGHKRTDDSWGRALRGATNVLLSELDEIGTADKPILVVGATNTPWSVDTALRRPGRFDRIIFVPPPDQIAREEILKLHLREKPMEDIDYAKIASKLDKFSGADIRDLVDRAVELAIRRAMRLGKTEPVTNNDLLSVAKEMRPSTIEWLATANDYVKYSNQSGLYDQVKQYVDKNF